MDGRGGPAFPHCRWRMSIFGVIILKTISLSMAFSLLSFVVYMEEERGKGRGGWLRRRRCLLRERGSGRVRGIHVAGGYGYVWRSPFPFLMLSGFGHQGKRNQKSLLPLGYFCPSLQVELLPCSSLHLSRLELYSQEHHEVIWSP